MISLPLVPLTITVRPRVAGRAADRAGEVDVDRREVGAVRSLTVTVSAPPRALTSMVSTSLRSIAMLPMLRVKPDALAVGRDVECSR